MYNGNGIKVFISTLTLKFAW